MKELIEEIAKALVDHPDQVVVRPIEGEQTTVLELRVAPSDLGKVIGKQGRTARSIPHHIGCGRHEAQEAVHPRDPGVEPLVAQPARKCCQGDQAPRQQG
jgi:hypothetical protein